MYANPGPLQALHERAAKPDWVWIASWIQNTPAADSDPHEATGVPDDQWPQHGQRAWQYAGRIARKLGIAGGWQALYALNRAVIGPDPDVLRPGEVLRLP